MVLRLKDSQFLRISELAIFTDRFDKRIVNYCHTDTQKYSEIPYVTLGNIYITVITQGIYNMIT